MRRLLEIGYVLAIAWLLLSPGDVDEDRPGPLPDAAAELARQCHADYAAGLAEAFASAAGDLREGVISEDYELHRQLDEAEDEARRAAFAPLDRHTQQTIGGEAWDPLTAAQLLEAYASGLSVNREATPSATSDSQ